jgi:hypothetical protein
MVIVHYPGQRKTPYAAPAPGYSYHRSMTESPLRIMHRHRYMIRACFLPALPRLYGMAAENTLDGVLCTPDESTLMTS